MTTQNTIFDIAVIGAGAVGREGQHRRGEGVAELQRDVAHLLAAHQRVAAVHVLRAALLGAAVVDQGRGLAGSEGLFDFGPRHHLELDVGRPRRRRAGRHPLCRCGCRPGEQRRHHHPAPRAVSHVVSRGSTARRRASCASPGGGAPSIADRRGRGGAR